jgi:competence protein ComEA
VSGDASAVPTPSERRALIFVAAVAALGVGVRGAKSLRPPPAAATGPQAALAVQIAAVESAVTVGGRSRAATQRSSAGVAKTAPAAPQPPAIVDVDRADAAELETLPGIGPALARRIVEDRAAHGSFGGLSGLQQVRGIGPALTAKLAPRVTFSGPPRPARAAPVGPRSLHP